MAKSDKAKKQPIITSAKLHEPRHAMQLASVWDCPKLEKSFNTQGTPVWICHWCDSVCSGSSACRALAHVLGVKDLGGKSDINIAKCPGLENGTIDETSRFQHQTFNHNRMEHLKTNRKCNHTKHANLHQEIMDISYLPASKKRKLCQTSDTSFFTSPSSLGQSSATASAQLSGTTESTLTESNSPKLLKQTHLGSTHGRMHVQKKAFHSETGEMHTPDAEE